MSRQRANIAVATLSNCEVVITESEVSIDAWFLHHLLVKNICSFHETYKHGITDFTTCDKPDARSLFNLEKSFNPPSLCFY